jgi:hypothetical protein
MGLWFGREKTTPHHSPKTPFNFPLAFCKNRGSIKNTSYYACFSRDRPSGGCRFEAHHPLHFQNKMSVLSARKPPRNRPQDDRERYYLLPGQGGSSYRRKQRFILKSSLIVGVIVSGIFALVMYLVYRPPH